MTAPIECVRYRWILICYSSCWIPSRPLSQRRKSRESGFRTLLSLSHRETSFRRDPPPFFRSHQRMSGGSTMDALLSTCYRTPSSRFVMHLSYRMRLAFTPGLSSHEQEQQGYDPAGIACDLGRYCVTDRQGARRALRISAPVYISCASLYSPSCACNFKARRSMVLRAVYLLAKQLSQHGALK